MRKRWFGTAARASSSMDKHKVLIENRELEKLVQEQQVVLPETSNWEDPFCKPSPRPSAWNHFKKIQLHQLQVGVYHTSHVLHGILRDNRAFNFGGIVITALEDEAGKVARLMLRNLVHSETPCHKVRARYPEGSKVVVREPCFVDGVVPQVTGYSLWVPNPANFEVVSRFPNLDVRDCGFVMKMANQEFEDGNFEAAVELYTKCYENGNHNIDALCSRAAAHLRLGDFSKAIRDADQVMKLDPGNGRCFLVKGQALVALRQYGVAAVSFKQAIQLLPRKRNAPLKEAYEEARRFDEQSRHGKFNIPGVTSYYPDFIGPVEVQMTSDGKGRGLFTTSDVNMGELLLVHNATVSNPDEQDQSDFLTTVSASCLASSRTLAQVSSSFRLEDIPSMELFKPNSSSITDDEKNFDIEFDISGMEWMVARATANDSGKVTGLWTLPRFLNHSCLPNVSIGRAGDARYVYAAKKLKAGTELVCSYINNPLKPWDPFRRNCECDRPDCPVCTGRDFFRCTCPRCGLERRLESHFEDISHRLVAISMEKEVDLATGDSRLARMAVEIEQKLGELGLKDEEKKWMRASYAEAYSHYYRLFRKDDGDIMPCFEEFLEDLEATAPGDDHTLSMIMECSAKCAMHDRSRVRCLIERVCLAKYGEAGQGMHAEKQVYGYYLVIVLVVFLPIIGALKHGF